MWTHPLDPSAPAPGQHRHAAAQVLRAASRLLDALAARLVWTAAPPATADAEPWLEYHAEAGAPEGALYVNGQLVGHLAGVRRL